MGKNSKYKSPHSCRKHQYRLSSMDVHLSIDDLNTVVSMSPQEAFHVVSMPAFEGFITSIVPNYELVSDELPEMPEKED